MKKLVLLFFALTFGSMAFAAPTPITGTLRRADGSRFNGKIVFFLPFAGINDTTCSPNPCPIVPGVVTYPVANGNLPTYAALVANGDMSTKGTYYQVGLFDSYGTKAAVFNVVIPSGLGTFDIGTASQTTVTTQNLNLVNPVSLSANNVFTGSNTFLSGVTFSGGGTFAGNVFFTGSPSFSNGITASKINGALNAAFLGGDIGTRLNASIALLPGSCGELYVPVGSYSFSVSVSKPRCIHMHGAAAYATALNYTGTGWAIVAADAQGTSIYPEGTVDDLTLNGPGAGTTAGGIYFGGDPANVISPSTSYGDHQNVNRVRIFGFGTGVQWGNNAWSNTLSQDLISNNGTGMSFPSNIINSGESIGVINTSVQNNNVMGMNLQLGHFTFTSSRCDYNLTCGIVNRADFFGEWFEQLNGIILTEGGAGPPQINIFGGEAKLTDNVSTDAKMFYVNSSLNPSFVMYGTALSSFHAVTNVINWNGSGANPVLNVKALPYYSTGGFIAALTNATCNFWGCHLEDAQNLGTEYMGSSLNIFGALQVGSSVKIGDSGNCTMTAGTCAAQTLTKTYSAAPKCLLTWDGTGALAGTLKAPSTTTTVTPASSNGADTAHVNWACFGF